MDLVDAKIIDILKENSRTTASEISKQVNLSIPAVSARIRKMEETGIIEKYTVQINNAKTGLKLTAFIFINIDEPEQIANFRQAINQFKTVLECYHIAGNYDYLIKVIVEDTQSLEEFISNSLKRIKGVVRTNTFIALSNLKVN